MRFASAALIRFTDLWFVDEGIQGVCSQIRRFAKARVVGRQKESSLLHFSALDITERSARWGRSRSWGGATVVGLGLLRAGLEWEGVWLTLRGV